MRDLLGKEFKRRISVEKRLAEAWKELDKEKERNRKLYEALSTILLEYTKLGYIQDNTVSHSEKLIESHSKLISPLP